MTTRHNLPSGAWVEIRDYRELTGRDVKAVNRSITGAGARAIVDMRAALIEILVDNWSLAIPLPATAAAAEMMRADDYVALEALVNDAFELVNGRSVIPNSDEHADPTPPSQDGTE